MVVEYGVSTMTKSLPVAGELVYVRSSEPEYGMVDLEYGVLTTIYASPVAGVVVKVAAEDPEYGTVTVE